MQSIGFDGLSITKSILGTEIVPDDNSFFVAKIKTKELILIDELDANPEDVPFETFVYGWATVYGYLSLTKYKQADSIEEGIANAPDGILLNPAFVTGTGQVGIDDYVFMRKRGVGKFSFRFSLFPETTYETMSYTYEIISKSVGSVVSSVQCVGNQLLVTYEAP